MNNKQIGRAWENEVCGLFAVNGWWVHFLHPDERGAQPFDIIAAKRGVFLAIECKTVEEGGSFSGSRLEDNQILALQKWQKCTNQDAIIAVKSGEERRYITLNEVLKDTRARNVKLMRPIDELLLLKMAYASKPSKLLIKMQEARR